MKKNIVLMMFILVSFTIYSQTIDQKIGSLINKGDWFTLKKELDCTDATKVDDEMLWNMANAFVNTYFNKPQQAIMYLNTLLDNYIQDMGSENSNNMAVLLAENYALMRKYNHASSIWGQLQNFLSEWNLSDTDLKYIKNRYKMYSAMANVPEQKIYLTGQPVNLYRDKSNRHNILLNIGQKTHKVLLSMGTAYSIISESTGIDFGIKILQDSIIVRDGAFDVAGKIGVIDRISVGNIIVENMVFQVVADSLISLLFGNEVDGVVGIDFLRELKLFEINNNKLYTNVKNNISLGNMMLWYVPYIECYSGMDTIMLYLDTKESKSKLSYKYYETRKPNVKRIKNFPVKIGDLCVVKYIDISSSPEQHSSLHISNDGALRQDIIDLYKKMIIDFESMSVILKN